MIMETKPMSTEMADTNGLQLNANLDELYKLCRSDIPEGRQTLLETQTNLENVADYCTTTYHESDKKKIALERTRNYTTHSLASVAYQINTLAFNILRMLDLQTNQISEMESQINFISQKVLFHKEKVARREIALLTSAKTAERLPKVLVPANKEKQAKYSRKPIDFSILDDIGHGIKVAPQPIYHSSNNLSSRMSGVQTLGPKSSMSMSQYHSYNTLGGSGPAPTTKPPTPPQGVRSYGTLSRLQSKEYRALAPPIAPPQVPKNYEPNYPIGHPKNQLTQRQNSGNYSTLPNAAPNHHTQYMPSMGGGHYGTNTANMSAGNLNSQGQYGQSMMHGMHMDNPTTPPLPPPPQNEVNDSLPDPPPMFQQMGGISHYNNRTSTGSPPLPPPPPPVEDHDQNRGVTRNSSIYGAAARHANVPDWVPPNYIEKVIAIYDYSADKDDELTFQENSLIYVIRKNDDGWFEGVLNGVTGLFPGNYVEPCI